LGWLVSGYITSPPSDLDELVRFQFSMFYNILFAGPLDHSVDDVFSLLENLSHTRVYQNTVKWVKTHVYGLKGA
jgi:hypothetical protein